MPLEVVIFIFFFGVIVGSAIERIRAWWALQDMPTVAPAPATPGPTAAFDACARAVEEAAADRVFLTLEGNPIVDAVEGARWARVGCFGCGDLEVVRGSFRHSDACPDWPGLSVPIADVLRQARPVPEPAEVDTSSWPDWP